MDHVLILNTVFYFIIRYINNDKFLTVPPHPSTSPATAIKSSNRRRKAPTLALGRHPCDGGGRSSDGDGDGDGDDIVAVVGRGRRRMAVGFFYAYAYIGRGWKGQGAVVGVQDDTGGVPGSRALNRFGVHLLPLPKV